MISDGHNLMLNSREEYRLWLLLKNLYDDSSRYFQAESENDMILRRWVESMYIAIDKAHETPMETVEL